MTRTGPRYPPLDLGYLSLLTDDTGLIQHALYGVPNRPTGYTTDDNARALLVAAQEYERTRSREAMRLASVYLAFLYHALTPDNYLHNLMSYDRRWIDARGSEDSHGRVLWATGYVASSDVPDAIRLAAAQIFEDASSWARRMRSPRAIAFSALGACYYARREPQAPCIAGLPERLGDQLATAYQRHRAPDWEWFEDSMTYSNAILPNALLMTHSLTGAERHRQTARATLDFLLETMVVDGVLHPIGCHGWYSRGGVRAWFDQQPVDVMGVILACLNGWSILGDERYRETAQLAFDWFFGHNALNRHMIDDMTGGCHDGLTEDGVNGNQGAETQVAYLLSYLAMARAGLASPPPG